MDPPVFLEPVDFEFQLATPAIGVDLAGGVLLTPPIIGRLRDPDFPTDVWNCQPLGQIAVCLAQNMRDFLGGPSPAHGSLRDSVYRRTPISAGPISGEQAIQVMVPAINPDNTQVLRLVVTVLRDVFLACLHRPSPFSQDGSSTGTTKNQASRRTTNRRKSLRGKYARGDLNPQPLAPEANALSS